MRPIVGLAACCVFLDHSDKVVIVTGLAEQVLKHGPGETSANGFVPLFQLRLELRELLDVCGQFAPDVPAVGGVLLRRLPEWLWRWLR